MTITVPKASAQVALSTRYKGADAPETQDARRVLAEAKIAAAIEKAVAAAPPLTADQRDRLHRIIDGGAR